MEGNYKFVWKSYDKDHKLDAVVEWTIYGKDLSDACKTFEQFHGPIGPDEDGSYLVIERIKYQRRNKK
jgi:hypothetical protein